MVEIAHRKASGSVSLGTSPETHERDESPGHVLAASAKGKHLNRSHDPQHPLVTALDMNLCWASKISCSMDGAKAQGGDGANLIARKDQSKKSYFTPVMQIGSQPGEWDS